jgi:D-alanine--poly(phosphoribitol) ligase subunit 1
MSLFRRLCNNLSCEEMRKKKFLLRPDKNFCYEQANNRIGSFLTFFDSVSLSSGDVIAVESDKSFDIYCLFLACAIKGITYIPISQEQNLKRILPSLTSVNVKLAVTRKKDMHKTLTQEGFECFNLSELNDESQEVLYNEISGDIYVYMMFSSGSTGDPKLIPITRNNLEKYIDSIEDLVKVEPFSRFSQIASLTFDLSVHDIYLCFANKGSLCPIKLNESLLSYRFANQFHINYWMSVPSLVFFMMDALGGRINEIPSVKCTFFLGEALSWHTARQWSDIASNGDIINLYGPTECTVAAAYYKLNKNYLKDGVVPIGAALKNTKLMIDENNQELLIGGSQTFSGYLGNNTKSKQDYLLSKQGQIFYRSGDISLLLKNEYNFKGRLDFQVKIRGYRIEIEELESILNKNLGDDFIVVPIDEIQIGNYESVAILYTKNNLINRINSVVEEYFPKYISVSKIVLLESIPRNSNGKLDRKLAKQRVQ